jgi:archaellum component FlaC
MADALILEFKAKTDDLDKRLKAIETDVAKTGKKVETEFTKSTDVIGSAFTKLGGVIAATFAVQNIIAFGKEAVNLAAKAEGVERAFARVGNEQILDGLRKATRGTVSDLVLMQNAVRASNFQIPLEQLASLFKFAQARARETGESVDYLVDSIILGIGRKSPMILDNLGISAVQLKEKLNGVSTEAASVGDIAAAVGAIATDNLNKIGEQADTTADKLAQLEVEWDNIKMAIGRATVDLAEFFGILNDNGGGLTLEADLIRTSKRAEQVQYALGVVKNEVRGINDETQRQEALEAKLNERKAEARAILKTITDIENQRGELTAKIAAADLIYQNVSNSNLKFKSAAAQEAIKQAGKTIEDGNTELAILKEQRKEAADKLAWTTAYTTAIEQLIGKKAALNEEDGAEIRNVYFLEAAIKKLNEELKAQGTSRERIREIVKETALLQAELKALLDGEAAAAKRVTMSLIEMSDAVPRLGVSLADLNRQLAEARKAKEGAFEFGPDLDKAIADIARLERAIKNFNDEQITGGYNVKANIVENLQEEAAIRQQTFDDNIKNARLFFSSLMEINNAITSAIMAGHEQERISLDNQLEAGQISREQYDQRRRQLEREKAQDAKTAAIFSAVIGTALAVVNALAVGPPQGYILAALSAALGAVEIGVISSQPLPQFAKGVIGLQGAGTETSDSIHARLSKGESVMTARETREHRPILEAIRKGGLERLIAETYVRPAVDSAMLSGFADMGRSADLNGLTAKLSDHNIIAAMDRNRSATVYGLKMLADKLDKRTPKRGGYA